MDRPELVVAHRPCADEQYGHFIFVSSLRWVRSLCDFASEVGLFVCQGNSKVTHVITWEWNVLLLIGSSSETPRIRLMTWELGEPGVTFYHL